MGWLYLLLAGICEVGFTTSLKLSQNFTRPLPSIAFAISVIASFWLLTKAMETIPLGTAYAVWAGIGAFGTVIVGLAFFNDPLNFWRLFFLSLLIVAIVGLKFVSSDHA